MSRLRRIQKTVIPLFERAHTGDHRFLCMAQLRAKKHRECMESRCFKEVLNGFEPMIRELQSHALPLGYSTTGLRRGPREAWEDVLNPSEARTHHAKHDTLAKPKEDRNAGFVPAIKNSHSLRSSPSRARTYNNSVNSRVLYH